MKMSIKKWTPLLLAASIWMTSVVGCGGGSGSATSGGASAASIIGTDDMNTGYDHVWVTIYSVDLVTSSGTVNAYTNSSGLQVDLSSLHDSQGSRFLWINNVSFPAGTYEGINVTVGNTVNVFTTGATTATAATFQSGTANYVMSLTFSGAKTVSTAHDDIVLDFNLANWTLSGGTITAPNNAFLSQGPTTKLGDSSRWQSQQQRGVVANLSGSVGSQTFTLGTSSSAPTVTTTSTTAIFNSDGSASPSLANGETVHVFGTYNSSTNTIAASGIEIEVAQTSGTETVIGSVSNISTSADTFSVTPQTCENFMPSQSTLSVSTSSSTVFYDTSGATTDIASFFTALASGNTVRVSGTLSGTTLAATSVWLQSTSTSGSSGSSSGSAPTSIPVKVSGTPSALNTTSDTFTLTSSEWEGFWGIQNLTLTVTFSSSTTWYQNGTAITAAAGEALLNGGTVQVRGTLNPSTGQLTATKISFRS